MHIAMPNPPYAHHATKEHDDWENWTDEDEPVTPQIKEASFAQIGSANSIRLPKLYAQSTAASAPTMRGSKSRQSNPKIQRLKSRKRQKAQNERAGIKIITDLTRFRKGPHHVAQLVRPDSNAMASETAIKFVDASALRALEGSPNSASVGNWAWLKGGQSPASAATRNAAHPQHQRHPQYSPNDSKIVIGISMPEQNGLMISPQTAVVATPFDRLPANPTQQKPTTATTTVQNQPTSAWSPDTEDGLSPARYLSSHFYAQSTGQVPPVPAVPSPFILKNPTREKLSRSEIDDDDDFTPVTLFEEDGKSPASALSKISPETTRSRSGWWDHVKTPFKDRFSPISNSKSATEKETASPAVTSTDEWWKSADEKKTIMPNLAQQSSHNTGTSSSSEVSNLRPIVPVIRVPTPTAASSSRSSPPSSDDGQSHSEKARAVVMQEHADPSDVPPPYEQTPSEKDAKAIRSYRAVFPPGHPLATTTQFPPSPMPVSPGLEASMMSQGHMKMSDVPLTPAPTGPEQHPALPDRVAGTYVTGEQFHNVTNDSSPAAKVEKARRRHEKEDYLARKVGGFWKGRGCLPEDGCYGRSGREGRKRRRVWLGLCLAFLLLTILAVVLGVVLSRKLSNSSRASSSSGSGDDSSSSSSGSSGSSGDGQASSVWLNLTDFPPIPTGLATVVGAANSEEVTGCVSPSTLWSCSLPPEQQAANEPQEASQPKFIFQIQYDNNTRQLWNIPNGDAPTPDTTTSAAAKSTSTKTSSTTSKSTSTVTVASTAASATSTADTNDNNDDEGSDLTRRDSTTLYDTGIAPNPDPPSYDEMWFLGNWTDEIVSDEKAGEPTPFYISFFTSLNGSAGPNRLTDASTSSSTTTTKAKRGNIGSGSDNGENITDTLPAPILNADGTGAAAQLHPFPYQQPLRLFDRGMPTEHYGFYSYFNKTIYVSSMSNDTSSSSEDGGVLESSAQWYATWTQTRFVVKIWTKKSTSAGGARLIGSTGAAASDNGTAPGSFPYPITVGEDTHGGDLSLKSTFAYGVEADQHVNTSAAMSFTNDIGYGSAVVNARLPDGDLSWGGIDGGKGGCRCEWVNWVNEDGTTDGSLG